MSPSMTPNPARRRRGRPDVLDVLAGARPASLDADPHADMPAATYMTTSANPAPPASALPARGLWMSRYTQRSGGSGTSIGHTARATATGLAVTATVAAVAVGVTVAVTGPGPGHPRAANLTGTGSSSPAAGRTRPAAGLSARALLLAAAEHVVAAPVTGRYWRVREEQIQVEAAGSKAHPYDMAVPTVTDTWLSPVAGDRDYYYSEQLGARPASPADAAAWRAAGSPRSWRSYGRVAFSTRPMNLERTWQYGQGKIGYLEGDLAFLTRAQFRALPATPRGLYRALYREAMQTWSAQHPGGGGATAGQLIWDEALQVLQDPVSPQVRAAAFRVMARLPGVRMLGYRRDPLGRSGYAFGTGHTALGEIAIIDPSTGSLLAYQIPSPPLGQVPVIKSRASGRFVSGLVGRPDYAGPGFATCLLVTGWTNTPPRFARTARHFDALIGY